MIIKNQRITDVRDLTTEEHELFYWPEDNLRTPTVLVLENGFRLVASRDPEGNGPGFLAGLPKDDREQLIGAEIHGTRPLSEHEHEKFGWATNHGDVPVVKIVTTENSELDESIRMYPATDPEMNGPGELWGFEPVSENEHPEVFAVGF